MSVVRGLLAVQLLVPVLASAADRPLSTPLDRPGLTFRSPESIRLALEILLDPESAGGPQELGVICRTPYLLAGLQLGDALALDAQALLASAAARPRAAGEVLPAGERVWLHTSRPDAREIADAIRGIVELVRDSLDAPQFPRLPLDVYVQALDGAPGVAGSVVWDGRGAPVGVLVSDGLPVARLRQEIAHQLVHVWQLERAAGTAVPAPWLEGAAVHASLSLAGSPEDLAAAIAPAIRHRRAPVDSMNPRLLRSRASLAAFLCEASGAGLGALAHLFRDLDGGFAARLDETLASLDLGGRTSFPIEHALWLSLTKVEDRGKYFSFGTHLPEIVPAPLDGNARTRVVLPPGSFEALEIGAATRDGGLWISARSRDDGALRGAVILRRSGPGDPEGVGFTTRVAPLPAAPEGAGYRIGVPLRWAEEAVVVLANTGVTPLAVQVATQHDPIFPYVLSSFTTEPVDGGVMVQWTVTEEQDVAGWRVQRSLDPSRGFAPLGAAIPSRGEARDPLTYSIHDTGAEPGRRYFYYLEGVSVYGFSQPSLMVSVTTPAR